MVREQLMTRDIHDPRVLHAMEVVPKDRFVPEGLRARAYGDTPLPIGHGQTILSHPSLKKCNSESATPGQIPKSDVGLFFVLDYNM
jgi:protein-L-isoaspartate O-methyltransferase